MNFLITYSFFFLLGLFVFKANRFFTFLIVLEIFFALMVVYIIICCVNLNSNCVLFIIFTVGDIALMLSVLMCVWRNFSVCCVGNTNCFGF